MKYKYLVVGYFGGYVNGFASDALESDSNPPKTEDVNRWNDELLSTIRKTYPNSDMVNDLAIVNWKMLKSEPSKEKEGESNEK